ncbi:MAG: hypothetical protein IJM02_05030 [Clostridia bacterium]|nr:hypothetical protein [Clostridia bacterium]
MNFRSLIAVVLVFSIALALCACRKLDKGGKSEFKDDMFVVDSLGETHAVETQTNQDTGETEYFYTDDLGNVVVVEKNDVGKTTAAPRVTTTGANGETEPETYPEQIMDFFEDLTNPEKENEYLEEVDTSLEISDDPIDTDNMKTVTPVMNDNGNPAHAPQQQFVQDITKNNQYTIKLTMKSISDGEVTAIPATIMRSGNNRFAEVKWPVEGKYVTMRILVKDGKCIMYLPAIRAYMEVPEDVVNEVLESMDYNSQSADTEKYVSSGKVTVNGTTYDVDIYDGEDGATVKYYYQGGELKRVENISKDDDIVIIEYEQMTTVVDKTKFIPPTGYFNLGDIQNGEELLDYLG